MAYTGKALLWPPSAPADEPLLIADAHNDLLMLVQHFRDLMQDSG